MKEKKQKKNEEEKNTKDSRRRHVPHALSSRSFIFIFIYSYSLNLYLYLGLIYVSLEVTKPEKPSWRPIDDCSNEALIAYANGYITAGLLIES